MNATLAVLPALLAIGGPLGSATHSPTAPRPRGSAAMPAAVITFRPSAEVGGRVIRLADVAAVEAADARLAARLEAVDVGAAPMHGHSRTVSAAYAQIRIRQIGVDVNRLQFHGPELITVSRPEQVLASSALQKVVRDAVEAANPGTVAQVSFLPADMRLPAGAIELKPEGAAPVSGSSGSLVVRVLVAGNEEARVPIGFRLLRMGPVLVSTRDLPVGQVLTETDLQVEQRPAASGPVSLSDFSQAIGQQVTYPIRAGSALTPTMLKPAVLIRRGSRIRLICRGPSFVATVLGEALQDGAAGQVIRMRNMTSLREVIGVVVNEETAEVPF